MAMSHWQHGNLRQIAMLLVKLNKLSIQRSELSSGLREQGAYFARRIHRRLYRAVSSHLLKARGEKRPLPQADLKAKPRFRLEKSRRLANQTADYGQPETPGIEGRARFEFSNFPREDPKLCRRQVRRVAEHQIDRAVKISVGKRSEQIPDTKLHTILKPVNHSVLLCQSNRIRGQIRCNDLAGWFKDG